jgi:signal transduction histidine kinase/CheY-like chemotaxis protein
VSDERDRELAQCKADLLASEARFRNIIEKNADGVVVLNWDGVVLYMNSAAEKLFACKVADCQGMLLGIPIVPDERTEVDIPQRNGQILIAEMRVTETEWNSQPARLASLRDVTDRKRAEEALWEADRRKNEFLAMLAHELRNPLAPIKNAAQVFRLLGPTDPNLHYAREVIDRQVQHMSRLVDDLLDISRITRGKVHLQKQKVEAAAVLHQAIETSQPIISSQRHQLRTTLPAEPIFLWGDLTRLAQIISNLLTNAAKYTSEGGCIDLRATRNGDQLIIEVCDTGLGIQPEMLDQVFELFTQVNRSLDRSDGGLGIGLTLVKRLVEMHDGTVSAHSEGLGRGSRFVVKLPILMDEQLCDEARLRLVDGRSLNLSRRILVVDDDLDSLNSLAIRLRLNGHKAITAHDGASALDAAVQFQPEAVIMDVGLLRRDGMQVLASLRSASEKAPPVFIGLTGYERDEERALIAQAAFDHQLVKPPDMTVLEKLLLGGPT